VVYCGSGSEEFLIDNEALKWCPLCGGIYDDAGMNECPVDGASLELRDQGDRFIGTTIGGRFQVSAMLGAGGMGSVYLARQLSVDRDVAIKILRKDTADDTLAARRFLLEAKATSRLKNDHTVTIYDFGQTDDGHLYIAMEFLEGRTLRAKLDVEGALSLEDTISVIDQIGESLAEAHEQGIVHRDLKPENVLLAARSKGAEFVKVLDFGIARAQELNDGGALTATGTVAGTPAYMSPEAVTGQIVDARADVYALGVMVYEMLSGESPFRGDTPFVVMQQHVMHSPPPLGTMLPDLPGAVSNFVGRCLMKNPVHRPVDASAFRRGLQLAIDGKEDTATDHATLAGHPNVMPNATSPYSRPIVSGGGATAAAMPSDPSLSAGGFDQTMPGAAILTPDANPVLSSSAHTAMGTGAVLDQVTATVVPQKAPKSAMMPMLAAVVLAVVGAGAWFAMSGSGAEQVASPEARQASPPTTPVSPKAPSAVIAPVGSATVKATPPPPVPAPVTKPEKSVMVSVSVVTTPDGAEVLHQGKVVGTTPTMVNLERSETSEQLLLTKTGFEAKVVEIVPSKNQLINERLVSNAPPPAAKVKSKTQRKRSKRPVASKGKTSAKPTPKPAKKPASRLDDYLD
jgi:serine/threonine protein kinase